MTLDIAGFAARQPRHETTDPSHRNVEIRRESPAASGPLQAQLVDLSRHGVQLRVPVALDPHENVTVQILDDGSGFSIGLSGAVRWQKPSDDGNWFVGCRFEQELDWETMGELFLREILTTD